MPFAPLRHETPALPVHGHPSSEIADFQSEFRATLAEQLTAGAGATLTTGGDGRMTLDLVNSANTMGTAVLVTTFTAAAINTALTAAGASVPVLLAPGDYNCSANDVNVVNGSRLIGLGRAQLNFRNGHQLNGDNKNNVDLINVGFDGGGSYQYTSSPERGSVDLVSWDATTGWNVIGCKFRAAPDSGLRGHGVQDFRVEENIFDGMGWHDGTGGYKNSHGRAMHFDASTTRKTARGIIRNNFITKTAGGHALYTGGDGRVLLTATAKKNVEDIQVINNTFFNLMYGAMSFFISEIQGSGANQSGNWGRAWIKRCRVEKNHIYRMGGTTVGTRPPITNPDSGISAVGIYQKGAEFPEDWQVLYNLVEMCGETNIESAMSPAMVVGNVTRLSHCFTTAATIGTNQSVADAGLGGETLGVNTPDGNNIYMSGRGGAIIVDNLVENAGSHGIKVITKNAEWDNNPELRECRDVIIEHNYVFRAGNDRNKSDNCIDVQANGMSGTGAATRRLIIMGNNCNGDNKSGKAVAIQATGLDSSSMCVFNEAANMVDSTSYAIPTGVKKNFDGSTDNWNIG